jgi:hypothetical protein
MCIRTGNGGVAAASNKLCVHSTTREVRAMILAREERDKQRRKAYRRTTPQHQKPGPVQWIAF